MPCPRRAQTLLFKGGHKTKPVKILADVTGVLKSGTHVLMATPSCAACLLLSINSACQCTGFPRMPTLQGGREACGVDL